MRVSQVRYNAECDSTYRPYCLECPGLVRMQIVVPFYWVCDCGAVHDERRLDEREMNASTIALVLPPGYRWASAYETEDWEGHFHDMVQVRTGGTDACPQTDMAIRDVKGRKT